MQEHNTGSTNGGGLATRVIAGMVVAIGSLALCGWMFDIPSLKTVFPGLISMKANTAVCFILAGISLGLQSRPGPDTAALRQRLGQVLGLGVFCMGFLVLCEWIFRWDPGIDQLLFRDVPEPIVLSSPGRMAPTTAINFCLLGLGLFLLDTGTRWNLWPAQYLTLPVVPITLIAFIGYFYGVGNLSGVALYASIALHTLIGFLLLCAGILLARPRRGMMALVMGATPGGIMVRRMLLPGVLVTVLFGGLAVMLERAGHYGLGFGTALLVTALIAFFAGLMWWVARALDRLELERQRGVEAVRETNARLDGVISSAMDAIISLDSQQRVVLFNAAAEKLFGVSACEVLGQSIDRFIPERFRAAHARQVEDFGKTGVSRRTMGGLGTVTGLRADGQEFPIEASISQIDVQGQKLFTVILRDVTERKQAEEAVVESEERLRFALETSRTGAWDLDLEDHTAFRSLEHDRIFGYAELLPQWSYETFLQHVLPEDRAAVDAKFRQATATQSIWSFECRIRRADGKVRWIWAAGRHRADAAGGMRCVAGIVQDITERKEAEEDLRRLKEELEVRVEERTAELAAANANLQDFATIVSHDLKTPLRGVATLAKWLQSDYGDKLDEEGREHLAEMIKRTSRMDSMIDDILQYSRAGRAEGKPEPVALAELVPAVLHDLAPPAHAHVCIAPGLPVVQGEPVRLRQLFQNLIGNAIKYANKPQVEIRVEWADVGSLWQFSVTDNGPGIEERHFERIFKIFQTLAPKDKTDSTGVGLALVKRIVERAGGRIWVESRLGEGSAFRFTWPKRLRIGAAAPEAAEGIERVVA